MRRDVDAIKLALKIVAAKTNDSRKAIAALPAGPEHQAAQQELDGVLAGKSRHCATCWTMWIGRCGWPSPSSWEFWAILFQQ